MTSTFFLLAGVLTAAFIAVLLRPLLRAPRGAGASQQTINAAVYAQQLAALRQDHAAGSISDAEFEAARDELQARLLEDEKAAPQPQRAGAPSVAAARRTAIVLALLLPLGAGGMYAWLGMPAAIDAPAAAAAAGHAQQEEIVRMIDALAERLKANPDNPSGWAMLARSYKAIGRFAEAEEAFKRVGPSLQKDPDLLTSYADLLAARTNSFDGAPMDMINQALAIDPNHLMGLMLAGTADYQKGQYAGAVKRWEKLVQVLGPDSPDAQQLMPDIAEARQKAGMPPAKVAAAAPQTAPAAPEEMVQRLAARLKANPNDPEGWERLARSYEVLGKPKEAEEARVQAQKYAKK
jgi:cytochrome c-type biogenesis protein CcmH